MSTETLVTYIYYQGIELIDISYAASIGVQKYVQALSEKHSLGPEGLEGTTAFLHKRKASWVPQ